MFALTAVVAQGALAGATLPSRLDFTPISERELDRRVTRGTVELLSLGCDLSLGQGTGVAVSPSRLLTNRHVVSGFRTLDVVADDRPAAAVPPAAVGFATDLDVATIRVSGLPVEPLPLSPFDPLSDEKVWVAGFPSGPQGTSRGLVVSSSTVVGYGRGDLLGQRGTVMRIRGAVRTGMSGGPVLDQAGRLAGLVFGVDRATDDTLVIPTSVLRQRPSPQKHPSC